jgi:hypothetical protein
MGRWERGQLGVKKGQRNSYFCPFFSVIQSNAVQEETNYGQ